MNQDQKKSLIKRLINDLEDDDIIYEIFQKLDSHFTYLENVSRETSRIITSNHAKLQEL